MIYKETNGTFSKNVDDWMWLTKKVPEVLMNYYKNGYCIVIVSNQTKSTEMKVNQIQNALSTLAIPSIISVAYEEEFKKPKRIMFDMIVGHKQIDMNKSFFVGDALGRQGDWSDVDKLFAENIGLKKILSPDDLFSMNDTKDIVVKENKNTEKYENVKNKLLIIYNKSDNVKYNKILSKIKKLIKNSALDE